MLTLTHVTHHFEAVKAVRRFISKETEFRRSLLMMRAVALIISRTSVYDSHAVLFVMRNGWMNL